MSVATMSTNHGDITIELFDEDAPKTVENFKKLAADGFYDGLIFHRIIKDFMIQGGCPQGTGTGGPGYTFKDEINEHKVARGALAMANAGPNTNGSQFFIVTTDAAPWLDGKHTVFGEVTSGMDVVDALEGLPTDRRDRPEEPAVIESVCVAPMRSTTSMPSLTSPNTVCFPSSHGASAVVTMKNCDPLVSGPALAIANAPRTTLCSLISSSNV